MMDLQRGIAVAGTWLAVSLALTTVTGTGAPLGAVLESAAFMGASSLASDAAHYALGMYPTGLTAAVGTGVMYAASQRVAYGSTFYVSNVVAGAGTEVLASYVLASRSPHDSSTDAIAATENAISTA